ncbi:N-succinyl-L,L-diaminopimelate desuccinylase [hydrothermal vent metagenome]|uniref:Succinyl-diaminopimelate desuccinylase n=1 Tax=hydrothermal vent metagenome TaxID=652676 RepID=A0A3B0W1V2_9ZZZZ
MSETPVIKLSQELIRQDSITPDDKGCQQLLASLLTAAGFQVEHKRFGKVDNLFAYHGKDSKNTTSLLFVGHTDVVPTGNLAAWKHLPFSATIEDGYLYGRGAADMKSAVAAFTLAMINFVNNNPNHQGKIALMLTSDEEGVAVDGVQRMMPYIADKHSFDYCIVGEPSSSERLGDVVRIGRRGSLHVDITIHGKQGHIAYPKSACNPVFLAANFIHSLSNFSWDEGNADFPPTSFQISAVKTSTATANIIPADLNIQANFRYSPESSESSLKLQMVQLLKHYNLNYSLEWNLSGRPFYCNNEILKSAIQQSITDVSHEKVTFNTAGGTSDGRFVAPFGIEVVELGVVNKTIHQVDEKVLVADVIKLQKIYLKVIDVLLR